MDSPQLITLDVRLLTGDQENIKHRFGTAVKTPHSFNQFCNHHNSEIKLISTPKLSKSSAAHMFFFVYHLQIPTFSVVTPTFLRENTGLRSSIWTPWWRWFCCCWLRSLLPALWLPPGADYGAETRTSNGKLWGVPHFQAGPYHMYIIYIYIYNVGCLIA